MKEPIVLEAIDDLLCFLEPFTSFKTAKKADKGKNKTVSKIKNQSFYISNRIHFYYFCIHSFKNPQVKYMFITRSERKRIKKKIPKNKMLIRNKLHFFFIRLDKTSPNPPTLTR